MDSIPLTSFIVGLVIGGFIGIVIGCLVSFPFKKQDLSKPHDDYD